ncbi:peptide-methionine (S)-S-oxide reductase [Candidatus Woesearchaeota archaeon CG10_big_fil_rev_8_21_14_0_10_45_16]|nr:MAG: peptide-methionine (S)-S-oxide reductase [Candidatus Woesearchaeota archaeon CG10_big_fil_rev_8_21_14_0_10_45_16]
MQQATFAAGCFWHPQAEFDKIKGVKKTAVGFMGGEVKNPSYKLVCSMNTGHAEVVHVEYDPKEVSYEQLLDVFWKIHDPTQINRQGPDVGEQYRSAIFYHTEEQKKTAERSKAELQKRLKRPVATTIIPAAEFYKAEEYHQKYEEKRKRI